MKISAVSGSGVVAGTPLSADPESLKGKGFETELRQAADALQNQQTASKTTVNRAAASGQNEQDAKKLRKVCQDMEAVFLNLLMTQMRASIPKDPLLGDSNAKNIMQSMLDTEMTKDMSKAGGIGLADMLYRQLSPTMNATKGQNTK